MYSRAMLSHILPFGEVNFIHTPFSLFYHAFSFLENVLELESRAEVHKWDAELC